MRGGTVKFALLIAAIIFFPFARAQNFGSRAQLWHQRSAAEKFGYLEGICEGLGALGQGDSMKLGSVVCLSKEHKQHAEPHFRFCGYIAQDSKVAANAMDKFYEDPGNSDVPTWAAIASFNDDACGEANVRGRLSLLQAKGRCQRQTAVIMAAGVSQAVWKKQMEECKNLK